MVKARILQTIDGSDFPLILIFPIESFNRLMTNQIRNAMNKGLRIASKCISPIITIAIEAKVKNTEDELFLGIIVSFSMASNLSVIITN